MIQKSGVLELCDNGRIEAGSLPFTLRLRVTWLFAPSEASSIPAL